MSFPTFPPRLRALRAALTTLIFFTLSAISATHAQIDVKAKNQQVVPPRIPERAEWERFQFGLRHARPMPEPMHALRPETETSSGDTAGYDPVTGETHYENPLRYRSFLQLPGQSKSDGRLGAAPESAEGTQKSAPAPTNEVPGPVTNAPVAGGPLRAQPQAQAQEEGARAQLRARPMITPTAPSAYTTPYSFPFNSEFRILLRFNDGSNDYYYVCSASASNSFQLLSAGHCVYNHDIRNNGTNIAGWAQEVWAWAAQTDVVAPVDPGNLPTWPGTWSDYPYGVAKMTHQVTYNAWIDSSDLNWDFSFLALDRRIGDRTGWMGREWGTTTTSLNFDGYPAEAPYVSSSNPYQYPGYDSGNVRAYTSNRIQMDAYTYGGHSGGGVWRYDSGSGNRYLEGVNSTSNRAGYAEATRYTSQTESDYQAALTDDNANRVPTARPQVIEYLFNTTSKSLNNSTAAIGGTFGLKLNAYNVGYAADGQTYADVYLTTNTDSVSGGRFIGTYTLGNLAANTYTVQTQNITVPTTVPPGTWYVGYVLRSSVAEYGGGDQTSVIVTNSTLTTSCTNDSYESDNSSSSASTLALGGSQSHTICAQGDQDWVKFTTTAPSAITLATSGSSGDTTLTLYNSSLGQIAYNDDNGTNAFSTISYTCLATPLPAGTYYAKVTSYNGNTVIPAYTLSLSATTCPAVSSLAFSPNQVVGGHSATGTVVLGGTAPAGGVQVNLTSNNSHITVPASVTVPAGSASTTFSASTTSGIVIDDNATITASYNGASKTAPLKATPPAPTYVLFSPASVVGRNDVTAYVVFSDPQPPGATVIVQSYSGYAMVPPLVDVMPGASAVAFTIRTGPVPTTITAPIQVTTNGQTITANLTITPR